MGLKNRRAARRLAAYILVLALCLSLGAPALADGQAERGVAWEDMQYVHYDPAGFYEGTDELTALAAGEDAQAVIGLYEQLYDELVWVWTWGVIAGLHYSADVTDEYWEEEDLYSTKLGTETADAFCTACNAVMNGPCAEAFAQRVGQEAADYYTEYIPATERELELADQEAELTNRYYELVNASGGLTYTYDGREWTSDMLYGTQGDMLYDRDPDAYWEVNDGLAKALNDQVGPLYVQLVQIRAEQAQIWDYDSYAEAAYDGLYGRDYTPGQAQLLCDQVKRFSAAYFDGLYASELWYMADEVTPALSAPKQVAALGRYVGRIDPALLQVWQFMTKYGLYDLTDDADSMDSGYTSTLYSYDCPFIYNRMYGNCYDLDDLSHEFGHFADAYFNPIPDVVVSMGSYDLFEIHSTGLEALFTQFYDEIYDEGADVARFLVLGGLVETIINGCIHDEFQRRVYAQPDMTLEQINAVYTQVCREYGMDTGAVDFSWQDVSHNFDSPLYYISYAVSALAALQLWDKAQSDPDGAAALYMDLLDRGAYEDGYLTVLDECGMRLFTEDGAVEDICRPVIGYMEQLESGRMQ